MQISKKDRRQRRALRTRARIRELGTPRLTVHRTPRHIYAQVFDAGGAQVIATASTVQDAVVEGLKGTGNVEAAKAVGRAIAEAHGGSLSARLGGSGFFELRLPIEGRAHAS